MDTHDMSAEEERLVEAATEVRKNAYAPYSGYRVGAALIDDTGTVHTGCNVENTAFPEGTCAEANVIGSMVAAGGKRIVAIAAVGGADKLEACTPCGGCRQIIREFADEHTRVLFIGDVNRIDCYSIDELLPAAFRIPD